MSITQGRWDWRFTSGRDNPSGIEFTADGVKLYPAADDLKLMCAALELYEFVKGIAKHISPESIFTARELIERIGIEEK